MVLQTSIRGKNSRNKLVISPNSFCFACFVCFFKDQIQIALYAFLHWINSGLENISIPLKKPLLCNKALHLSGCIWCPTDLGIRQTGNRWLLSGPSCCPSCIYGKGCGHYQKKHGLAASEPLLQSRRMFDQTSVCEDSQLNICPLSKEGPVLPVS